MKTEYPTYPQNSMLGVEKGLSQKSKQIVSDFLKKCSITAGEIKVGKIKRNLLQFFDITELQLDEQTKESVDSFLVVLNKSYRSVYTKNEMKVYLKQFLKWFYKNLEMIENIKTTNLRIDESKINENNLLTKDDVEKMLRFAESYKEKAYLLLIFQTGARPQEILDLTWKDIKFQDKYADINLNSKKTGRSRTFPVVKQTMESLREWKKHYSFSDVKLSDYVFPSRWRDKRMTTNGGNKMLRRMSKSAGLNKDVWNYLARHSTATRLYEELPTPIVEKLMGHKNMAGIYAHISSKKAREEMLNKIYKIEDLTPKEKKEIAELKKGLEYSISQTKKFKQMIEALMKDTAEFKENYDNKLILLEKSINKK